MGQWPSVKLGYGFILGRRYEWYPELDDDEDERDSEHFIAQALGWTYTTPDGCFDADGLSAWAFCEKAGVQLIASGAYTPEDDTALVVTASVAKASWDGMTALDDNFMTVDPAWDDVLTRAATGLGVKNPTFEWLLGVQFG